MGDRAVFVGVVFAGGVLVGMSFPAGPAPTGTVTVRERWAPLTQWTCDAQERREYLNACAHRERMDGILRSLKDSHGRSGRLESTSTRGAGT